MTIDMSQFFQAFFDETEELLAEMEKLLLALDLAAPDSEDLNAIFRAAHSIKGGAATFGLGDLTEVTHVLETLLDRIRKGEMALTADHVDAFLAAKDVLKMQLDGHHLHTEVDADAVAAVRVRLQALAAGGGITVTVPTVAQGVSAPPPATAAPAPAPAAASAPAPTPAAAAVAPASGAKHYRLELPKVQERDVAALAAELGLLGEVKRSAPGDNPAVLRIVAPDSAEDIIAICSFILNPDEFTLSEENAAPAAAAHDTAFYEPYYAALTGKEVARPPEEQGYGFFDAVMPNGARPDAAPAAGAAAAGSTAGHASAEAAAGTGAAASPMRRASDKPASDKGGGDSSIRVSVEKVDQLINLIGELVITQAMIEQRAGNLDPVIHERLLNSVSQLTRNTRDLQEAVMSIRMMPMDYVFSRFPRMVRDLAAKLGKKVEFVTHGAATELDKGLIERIIDPLTHLVRNSVDHGIEAPEARKAAGKNETGRLSLSATHQGGNIVIEVTDDGGGLHRDRILSKAKQSGLPVHDGMPDSDVWQLIFAPGFSTAEVVTDVSGRGVGMDVVKRNITTMGGTVDIRSSKGFGTTISVSLPLTLAILDGMSIRVGKEIYIMPLGYVIESLQPAPNDIKEISGRGKVVRVRGEYLPLIPLYQLFGIEPEHTDPVRGILVILESEGKKAALFVDDLVGQQQVVVKNLESNYHKVAGLSGATILGDGGVALILDVSGIMRSSARFSVELAAA